MGGGEMKTAITVAALVTVLVVYALVAWFTDPPDEHNGYSDPAHCDTCHAVAKAST